MIRKHIFPKSCGHQRTAEQTPQIQKKKTATQSMRSPRRTSRSEHNWKTVAFVVASVGWQVDRMGLTSRLDPGKAEKVRGQGPNTPHACTKLGCQFSETSVPQCLASLVLCAVPGLHCRLPLCRFRSVSAHTAHRQQRRRA